MSAPVFLAEPGTLDGVTDGATYLLDGSEGWENVTPPPE